MDAKERREKIKEAIWQTLSEPGIKKLNFTKIKKAIDARIPEVHKYFLSDGFKEKEWNLEIQEVLNQLRKEDEVELSGVDEYQLKIKEGEIEIRGLEET